MDRSAGPAAVGEQMARLAEAIGLAAPTDTTQQATAALLDALGRRSRWLLVFDDAESRHQLARFLPAGPGHLLVASTESTWGEHAEPLVVPVFTRDQSDGGRVPASGVSPGPCGAPDHAGRAIA